MRTRSDEDRPHISSVRPDIGIGAFDARGLLIACCGKLSAVILEASDGCRPGEVDRLLLPAFARSSLSVRTIALNDRSGVVRGLWLVERKGQELSSLDGLSQTATFADAVTAIVRRSMREAALRAKAAQVPGASAWTNREEQVLKLIAWGHPTKAIAHDLGISVKTVEFHRTGAMRKAGFRNRVELMNAAVSLDWFSASSQQFP